MAGLELSSLVTTKKPYTLGNPSARRRIAVMDYGVKKNILRNLVERDSFLQVFPADTSFREIRSWNPDGILLSNGPGDPSVMPKQVAEIKLMLEDNAPSSVSVWATNCWRRLAVSLPLRCSTGTGVSTIPSRT